MRTGVRLHFQLATGEAFDVDLTDEQWAVVTAYRRQHALTLDAFFARILSEFMATHPIIAQTRTVQ